MTSAPAPSWWAQARKALLALAVAIVGAGATITTALQDDHVTVLEGWTIALAVLALLVGPAAVYGTRNARTLEQVSTDAADLGRVLVAPGQPAPSRLADHLHRVDRPDTP